jgi:DNA polymerase-3 subunit epsilon
MRQIVLDTETTGLDPALGHRVIEIAAVEIVNRRLTGNHFHHYLNPEREIDAGALQVHGISVEFLQDKPHFGDIADEFVAYLNGAELIIHNAPFDVGFLNQEFGLLERAAVAQYCPSVVDTLKMAKELHPGQRNNLDALCKRYQVDNSARTLHGALLDAELLAEVYLAMTRGQETLDIEAGEVDSEWGADDGAEALEWVVLPATAQELQEHDRYLEELDKANHGTCLWNARPAGEG